MTRAVPLIVPIVTGDTRSISQQIVDSIRLKISTGELALGDKLPSVRGLAQQLGVNPNTISKAFAQLIADGWLESRAGLGLFVTHGVGRFSGQEQERRLGMAVDRFVSEVVALRYDSETAISRVADAFEAIERRRSA